MYILIGFAFLAGVVTILSPCILPVLPIILSSSTTGSKKYPWGVVAGFIVSFTFFTVFLTSIVKLTGISPDLIRSLAIAIILIFGLVLIFPKLQAQFEILASKLTSKFSSNKPKSEQAGFGSGFVVGSSLGLIWTPCVGPILASVIALSLTGTVTGESLLVVLAYAIGTAIPMLATLYGGRKLIHSVPGLLNNLRKIQAVFGILLILVAIGLFFNVERKFQTYILDKFPKYGAGLTKIEDSEIVKEKLNMIGAEEVTEEGELAPELIPTGEWFNSDPLTLESLKGKVVLVDFWTYSCINCIRTLPYLRSWHENYSDDGLVIVGVHTPEFEFEKSPKNLYDAIQDFELKYPIVQDNDYKTWRAYKNRYWPAKYLINHKGEIVYTHFGEGKYDETEKTIVKLLKDSGAEVDTQDNNITSEKKFNETPELYLGFGRIKNFASPEAISENKVSNYSAPTKLNDDQFAYIGDWLISEESAAPTKGSKLKLNFKAKKVFMVARPKSTVPGQIKVTASNSEKTIEVNSDKLYELVNQNDPDRNELEIKFLDNNIEIYTFTFG